MARIDLDDRTLPGFERRIATLDAHATPQWGTMNVARMFAHLRLTLEISLEERPAKDESRPWLLPVLWVLMFEWWTRWPHGLIQASPQFLDDTAGDAEAERAQLLAALRRFVQRAGAEPDRKVLEPMLGRVTLRRWRRIHGIHTDYHLRQFRA